MREGREKRMNCRNIWNAKSCCKTLEIKKMECFVVVLSLYLQRELAQTAMADYAKWDAMSRT